MAGDTGDAPTSKKEVCRSCDLLVASCFGSTVVSKRDYWTFNNNVTGESTIYYCPNKHCEESTEETLNVCSDNRDPSYPLCTVCKQGYSEWGNKCISK